jgi:hypothetical protein
VKALFFIEKLINMTPAVDKQQWRGSMNGEPCYITSRAHLFNPILWIITQKFTMNSVSTV